MNNLNNITEEEFNRRFRGRIGSGTESEEESELSAEKVDQWLDCHEDFVTSYFSRKAIKLLHLGARKLSRPSLPRIVCDSTTEEDREFEIIQISACTANAPWMHSMSSPSSTPDRKISFADPSESSSTPDRKISDFDRPPLVHSMSSSSVPVRKISGVESRLLHSGWSASSTPTRKLSTMSSPDFDRDLNRIISEEGGAPTFLRKSSYLSSRQSSRRRKSNKELQNLKNLNEEALLIELVQDIANDLDITSLSHKILQNVSILTNADRCSLFLVQKFTEGHRILVSKVYNCNADSTVEDISANEEIVVPWGMGIIGYVAQTGEKVNIPDAYADARFNRQVDKKTGYQTKSLLCVPIKSDKFDDDGNVEVVGVAQVLNKNGHEGYENEDAFTDEDEKIFEKYLTFCGIGISNAQLFEQLEIELKRNEVLLDLARVIFEEQSTLNNIVHKIMQNTQSLIECERLSLLLLDPGSKASFSQVFDLEARDFVEDGCRDDKKSRDTTEVKFPINIGITGHVATTGETLNIPNAYEDPRFDPTVETDSTFKSRTILCMPVRNSKRDIIGVVQLVNKTNGKPFSTNDKNLFEAFAIFCGMAICNTTMYEDCMKAWARQKIALDLLSYHATASASETVKLTNETVPTSQTFRLREFSFDDAALTDHETVLATLRMFSDLHLIDRFRIDYQTLCSWVLTVKKNYRHVVYHNWRHAFNVTQAMFLMLKENREFKNNFSDEEKCALMIGCLCHDIDHRGLNNNFQVQTSSPLAQLYGTSVMERHHLDHCIMILNSSGNEVLNSLATEEYNMIVKVLEQAILATDLALYFKLHTQYFDIVKNKSFQWTDHEHKSLLRSMMMTACDLSAICKPWQVQERVAYLVAEEFWQQGDQEQKELHVTPIAMMDRAKHDKFPQMQVGYIDFICMPIYEHLAEHYGEFQPMLNYCCDNRKHWLQLAEKHKQQNEENTEPKIEEINENCTEAKGEETVTENSREAKGEQTVNENCTKENGEQINNENGYNST